MSAWRAWRAYWFRPAPLFDLAVVRIAAVAFQLQWLLRLDRRRTFAEWGGFPDALYDPLPLLRLLTLPFGWRVRPMPEVLEVVYWVTVATGVFALAGVRTSVALAVFTAGNVFLIAFRYSFGEVHHPEAIMMIALGVLALSPAGRILSVDDLLRRIRRARVRREFEPFDLTAESSLFARWPLLTVRWLFALVYLSAATSKLATSGLDWVNGYTLQFFMLRDGVRWDSQIGIWLGQHYPLALVASWVTVLFETTFVLVLLVPALALVYLPIGVGLHTGIYLTQRAPFFQFVTLYSVFVPWSGAVRWAAARRASRPKPQVLFDDGCPLCVRSMVILRYADWFDRLAYLGLERRWAQVAAGRPDLSLDACRREMHVILPDGTLRRGFFAVRALLRYLPPLWPMLLLLHAPGASIVGPRLYALVARRRSRVEGCTFATCGVEDAHGS